MEFITEIHVSVSDIINNKADYLSEPWKDTKPKKGKKLSKDISVFFKIDYEPQSSSSTWLPYFDKVREGNYYKIYSNAD